MSQLKDRVLFSSENSPAALVVGSVAFDKIITPTQRIDRTLGGAASYASIAASYYSPVRLVGVVGHDLDTEFMKRFERRKIDLEGLKRDDSGPTFFWSGQYSEGFSSRETLETQLNVFERFRPNLPVGYLDTRYILLGNIDPDLQLHVLEQLQGEFFSVADSMDLWINTKNKELRALIKRVDCLALNDSEAILLTGERNLIRAGRKLLTMGPTMAIIKKGEHGAYLFHPEGLFALPSYPVTAVQDPTGAGDSFAGAFVGYLAAKDKTDFHSVKKAMIYAAVTASLTIEAFSCDALELAGAEAIEQRYIELVNIVRI